MNSPGVTARIIELMPETPVSRYRLDAGTKARLAALKELTQKTEVEIIEDAVAHLLGALEHEEKIWPARRTEARNRHKRTPPGAA